MISENSRKELLKEQNYKNVSIFHLFYILASTI